MERFLSPRETIRPYFAFLALTFLLITGLPVACQGSFRQNVGTPPPPLSTLPYTMTPTNLPPVTTSVSASDSFAMNARLGRGVNLSALEAPHEGEWGTYLQAEYFVKIAEAGFTSVRLPVRFSAHASAAPPYTISPSFLARVDWAVQQALNHNLAIVLDMHHYLEMMSEPEQNRARFLALWEQLAEHYREYPPEVMFELLNEPNQALTAPLWNEIVAEVLVIIRRTNPTRIVIVGPVNWNGHEALPDLKLPAEDRYLIATFHYYLPFTFTHQGADWVEGSDAWLGTTWEGTPDEQQAIQGDFAEVAAWARANGRPIYLGEFGAYRKADLASRLRWTDFVARQAETNDFSWSYWEFCAGFGIYDPQQRVWQTDLLQALLPMP